MEANRKKTGNALDLTLVLKPYEDKWVVLSEDNKKVLAHGDSFDDIVEKVMMGIVLKVPRFDSSISPSGQC